MPNCPACGDEVAEGARFCGRCGAEQPGHAIGSRRRTWWIAGIGLAALAAIAGTVLAAVWLARQGSDRPATVAVVGEESVTMREVDRLLDQARAGYGQQKRAFPRRGSQEYRALCKQAIDFLVQRAEFEQKARELGVGVTEAAIDTRVTQLRKQYFSGNEEKFRAQIEKQGLTLDQVRIDVRSQLIQQRLYDRATEGVGTRKRKQRKMTAWVKDVRKQFDPMPSYRTSCG